MAKKCAVCTKKVSTLWDRIFNGKIRGMCADCKDYYERP